MSSGTDGTRPVTPSARACTSSRCVATDSKRRGSSFAFADATSRARTRRQQGGAGMKRIAVALACWAWCTCAAPSATAALTYVMDWGSFGSGPTQFAYPLGIALSPGGDIYVADGANNRVSRYTADGQFVAIYGSFGTAAGQFREPNHLMFSPTNGDLYVTDLNNQRI